MTRRILLGMVLMLAIGLRFYGLDWGTDRQTGIFHAFHPDEKTLVDSAALVGVNVRGIVASYGKAPMYALAGAARMLGLVLGVDPFDGDPARFAHLVGRGISALLGTLTVWMVFLIGRAMGGVWTGVSSAFFLAVCPGHIQQSHYYTVDISLAFWVSVALYLAIKMPSERIGLYAAFGLVIGLATGTRLVGVWLGLPFVLTHILKPQMDTDEHRWRGKDAKEHRRRVRHALLSLLRIAREMWKRIGLAIVVGVMVALACTPLLVLDADLFFNDDNVRRLIPSMQVARGEVVRIWALYDFSTTPYVFYFTHLLRDAMGYPLEILGILGAVLAMWTRNRSGLILLSWLIPYFLLVGGLHTKPIRYATPMLPVFAVLGAWLCAWLGAWLRDRFRVRWIYGLPALPVGLYGLIGGVAMARIYGFEDARIVAARWVAEHIPEQACVLVERGGFPTVWMAPENRYRLKFDEPSFFLNTEGCFPYWEQVNFVEEMVRQVDWMVVIEENRMRQFDGVADRYPIGHAYYEKLRSGDLGFEPVKTFQVLPTAPGWVSHGLDAEPTVTAYDHPAVVIFKRTGDVDRLLAAWREDVRQDPHLPDRVLLEGVAAYHEQNWEAARQAFARAVALRPDFALGHMMVVNTYFREGRAQEAEALWKKLDIQFGGIPAEVGMGMVKAGLRRDGVLYLERSLALYEKAGQSPGWLRPATAESWCLLGEDYLAHRQFDAAEKAFERSAAVVSEYVPAYLGLGQTYLKTERAKAALAVFERAQGLDLRNAEIWYWLGQAYEVLGEIDSAQFYYRQAMGLNPSEARYREAFEGVRAAHQKRDSG